MQRVAKHDRYFGLSIYWLRLHYDKDSMASFAFKSIHAENLELTKMLSSILLTAVTH